MLEVCGWLTTQPRSRIRVIPRRSDTPPDVGGAHLVVDRKRWERATEEQRATMRWGASLSRDAVVVWEGKPLARWDDSRTLAER